MMLLRSFDDRSKLFRLDRTGGLTREQPVDDGSRPPIDGVLTTAIDGSLLALYRNAGQLQLQFGHHIWPASTIRVRCERVEDRGRLLVEHSSGIESIDYSITEPYPSIDDDPTPFVTTEDHDFGLFVAGVLDDSGRAGRVFSNPSDRVRPDPATLEHAAAVEAVSETDWVSLIAGPDRDRAIAELRSFLRHADTAVIAASAAVALRSRIPLLTAHVLDVVASESDETGDIVIDAMRSFWRGESGPLPWLLQSAPSSAAPKVDEGRAIVVKAMGVDTGKPYFDNPLAARWSERWWGVWGFQMQHLGLPVERESLALFRSDAAPTSLRAEVTAYLNAAPVALAAQQPSSPCDWCGEPVNPSTYRSDGAWLWPDDLAHLVVEHDFVVPHAMVDHIRSVGTPPQRVFGPDDNLPWPTQP